MPPRLPAIDAIARRLRERRSALGLSLAQAAARAGIKAPSFLHHIERGERLPSEEVVASLAGALEDDEELLRAWVRLRRGASLDLALAAARRVERHLASIGDTTGSVAGAPHETGIEPLDAPVPQLLMRVPRLEWGTDPSASTPWALAEVLRFDPQSLPREAWLRPFAYRLPSGMAHPAPLKEGDLVLITRNAWPLHPHALYLVRTVGGPRLGRAAWRDGTLWLEGERAGHAEPLPPAGPPPRELLGRVGAVIRSGVAPPDP